MKLLYSIAIKVIFPTWRKNELSRPCVFLYCITVVINPQLYYARVRLLAAEKFLLLFLFKTTIWKFPQIKLQLEVSGESVHTATFRCLFFGLAGWWLAALMGLRVLQTSFETKVFFLNEPLFNFHNHHQTIRITTKHH